MSTMLEVLIRGNTGLAHKENWTCWDSNHRPLNPWIVVCDHYTTCPHSYPAALRFYYDTRAVEVHPAARIILQHSLHLLSNFGFQAILHFRLKSVEQNYCVNKCGVRAIDD